MPTVIFKAREQVDFAGKAAELNHLTVSGTTPQGQAISLDFWVDDNRKLIKIASSVARCGSVSGRFRTEAAANRPQQSVPKG